MDYGLCTMYRIATIRTSPLTCELLSSETRQNLECFLRWGSMIRRLRLDEYTGTRYGTRTLHRVDTDLLSRRYTVTRNTSPIFFIVCL